MIANKSTEISQKQKRKNSIQKKKDTKEEKRTKNKWDKSKANSKMVGCKLTILTTTLNVNSLNKPLKRQTVILDIKTRPNYALPTRNAV